MTAAIFCRDLRKRYPARPAPVDAVNGLDLEVATGECFGLLGPNGAGKTTTIEILEGLLAPTSGEVAGLGQRWGEDDATLRQRLGISLQETGRTILLTTHYMDEAERLCDRVAVVDHGRVIALGSPAELIARIGGNHLIEFALPEEITVDEGALRGLPAVVSVRQEGDAYCLTVTAPHVAVPALLQLLQAQGKDLARLTTRHASLEDVFVTLTGRHLRDDATPAA
jgi:ABC-type multidrug transport system ATPase subunit